MSYTYDFSKASVVLTRLVDEIIDAELPEPEGATHNVGETPYDLHIMFSVELDSGQQTTLAGVVSNHPTLAATKADKKQDLARLAWLYMESRYACGVQRLFNELFIDAQETSKTNRCAHIETWMAWDTVVAEHVKTKWAEVDAAETIPEVEAIQLDTATLDAADPGVTFMSILAITN